MGKVTNELGNRYGKLLVIESAGINSRREAMWKCQCDCGNIKNISGSNLRRGQTKSCGCIKSQGGKKNSKSEIGNIYGKLTVIKRAGSDKYRHALWECKCECGNITTVTGSRLRGGVVKSCGCMQGKSETKIINEIGNKYGRLTVIEQAENGKDGKATWKCQCECGNIVEVRGTSLRNGDTKSCGCLREDIGKINLVEEKIGNKYGKLTVIEKDSSVGGKAA